MRAQLYGYHSKILATCFSSFGISEALLARVNGLDHLTALVLVDVLTVGLGVSVEHLGPLFVLEHSGIVFVHSNADLLHEHLAFLDLVDAVI